MNHDQWLAWSTSRQTGLSKVRPAGVSRKTDRIRLGVLWLMAGVLVLLDVGCGKQGGNPKVGARQSTNAEASANTAKGLPQECLARLSEIRQAGYPATIEELDQWYAAVPAGENAAAIYSKAFVQLVLPGRQDPHLPMVGGASLPASSASMSAPMIKAISDYVTQNQAALGLLHEVAKLRRSRYPVDFKLGAATQLPHLKDVKAGAQLLSLQAILAAEKGDRDLAVQAILAELNLAGSLEQEPVLISQLVRFASINLAKTALERLLSRTTPTEEQLQVLLGGFAAAEHPESLTRAIIGERCLVIDGFRTLPQALREFKDLNGDLVRSLPADYAKQPVFIQDFEVAMGLFENMITARQRPLPQALEIEGQLEAAVTEAQAKKLRLTVVYIPALGGIFAKEAEHIATVHAAQTALAIERYRLAHQDSLPNSIEELVPMFLKTVPQDPFTGQPLLFKVRFLKTYVVYSVGKDRADDGGAEKIPSRANAHYDITFGVAR